MGYKRFNRHESMSDRVYSQIREILNIDLWDDSVTTEQRRSVENAMYGLYDGYLYDSLLVKAKKLPKKVGIKIIEVWHICNKYPESTSQVH
tara:strand:- start:1080 stop:1352 length:273 start_codon:yes stop_codon:yes gene_type:complete